MKRFTWFDWLALTLLIIGALNWGLVGFFNYNLVSAIFGPALSRIIYAIVGLTGLYAIISGLSRMARKEP
ncbi:MAG: DUF378 domain-containing protein [bacterium]|nr:DUF378 domain-containing protein [bacterium]